jgi:hypothetical protein
MPPKSSDAYLWWSLGAADEARRRDEGLSPHAREVREFLEAIARLGGASTSRDLVVKLANMYAPDVLRRRHRYG